jgi:hypothetical protein
VGTFLYSKFTEIEYSCSYINTVNLPRYPFSGNKLPNVSALPYQAALFYLNKLRYFR